MTSSTSQPRRADRTGRTGTTVARLGLGAVGVLAGLYGAYLLLEAAQGEALVSAVIWLAGGVLAHDVLVAAVSLLVGAVVTRLLPPVSRGPAVVGLVVVGTITVVAIPFLGRFGALPTNPTLLPRDYVGGYLLIVGLVLLGVLGAVALRLRRGRTGPADGTDGAGSTDDAPHGS